VGGGSNTTRVLELLHEMRERGYVPRMTHCRALLREVLSAAGEGGNVNLRITAVRQAFSVLDIIRAGSKGGGYDAKSWQMVISSLSGDNSKYSAGFERELMHIREEADRMG